MQEVPRDDERLDGISELGTRVLLAMERVLAVSFSEDGEGREDDEPSSTTIVGGGDEPIDIQSEEIEVQPQADGGRRILFRESVVAEQGTMRLQCDRLEAIYPAGEGAPARFEATGNVFMRDRRPNEAERTMRCDRGVFFQSEERLVCTGNAELQEGEDRVRGKEIEILFDRDVIKVRGGAQLNLGQAR